jgi:hypothetical protein
LIQSVDHSGYRFLGWFLCCEPRSGTNLLSISKESTRPRQFSVFHHFLCQGRKE